MVLRIGACTQQVPIGQAHKATQHCYACEIVQARSPDSRGKRILVRDDRPRRNQNHLAAAQQTHNLE